MGFNEFMDFTYFLIKKNNNNISSSNCQAYVVIVRELNG
ncbi:hypothetical protein RINTHH_21720 [Richelia intracellularis HH01]|jgi:hypothetical protein|uniref:Uncharacterized protein n=1 Tax=Richelia intracellularis HH01 TaxID=1165094 RepID=M1X0J9_9NOST|nr:hypothetical protein RINTHH_21720 [Richelia intracellularis HH01]